MKKVRLNLDKFICPHKASSDSVYEVVKRFYTAKKYKKSLHLSLMAYKLFGNAKDEYQHPKFLKEAYRASLEIAPNSSHQKIKRMLARNLPKGDQCVSILANRVRDRKYPK